MAFCASCEKAVDEHVVEEGGRFLCPTCAEARLRDVKDALKNLVDKLDLIEKNDEYQGVWGLYHVHGGNYKGPTYEQEIKKARALLKEGKTNG